jgi:DNA-binding transcriptional ArsR family regulator
LEKIKRRTTPTPVFEKSAEVWETVAEPRAAEIVEAQTDPVRRLIIELLDYGSMRKFELARYVHRILGKKYSRSLIQYHLKVLERTGLIGTIPDPEEKKATLVYKSADVRIQLKPREVPPRAPKLPEDMMWSLMKKYGRGE